MFFPDGRVEDYNAGRTASDIVQMAMVMYEEVAEPPGMIAYRSKYYLYTENTRWGGYHIFEKIIWTILT